VGAPAPSRLRDHPALLAITIAAPLLEAVPLRYFQVTAGLAPQITTLTPFAVFHDLRWVLVFHSSWTAFGLELLALVAVRSAFHAAVVRAAWPRAVERPAFRETLGLAVKFTLVVLAADTPAAVLVFAGGATSLSWLVFAALPLFLLTALVLSHGGITRYWWTWFPHWHSIGWTLLTFVVLNLVAASVLLGPWWLAWLSAGLGGLFNAWAWRGLVGSLATRAEPGELPRFAFVLPRTVLLLVMLFAGAIGVTAWQLHVLGSTNVAYDSPPPADGRRVPVLLASGFESSWNGRAAPPDVGAGFVVRRFSYAGLDAHGRPLPYSRADTHASIGHLETLMHAQVAAFAAASHEPIRIIATSEGSLVARSFVQEYPDAPVDDLVMISPLVEPGRVYYPPDGRDGWGVGARGEMDALSSLLRVVSGTDLDPGMPFLRSVVDHAPTLRRGLLCPAPRVRILALLPVASDASIPPLGAGPHVPLRIIPGFHGAGEAQAFAYLATGRVPGSSATATVLNRVIRSGATAWMVPELPVPLNRAWTRPRFDGTGCPLDGWPKPLP
jgi:hypothetical protein